MTNAPSSKAGRALDAFLRGPAVVVLSLLLLVLVNWYAARHYTRWDWTSSRAFTLSARSVEIARDQPLRLKYPATPPRKMLPPHHPASPDSWTS